MNASCPLIHYRMRENCFSVVVDYIYKIKHAYRPAIVVMSVIFMYDVLVVHDLAADGQG